MCAFPGISHAPLAAICAEAGCGRGGVCQGLPQPTLQVFSPLLAHGSSSHPVILVHVPRRAALPKSHVNHARPFLGDAPWASKPHPNTSAWPTLKTALFVVQSPGDRLKSYRSRQGKVPPFGGTILIGPVESIFIASALRVLPASWGTSPTLRGTDGQSPSPMAAVLKATFPSLHLTSVYALSQPRAGSSINEGHAERRSRGAEHLLSTALPRFRRRALARAVALQSSQRGNSIRNPSDNGMIILPLSWTFSQLSGEVALLQPREVSQCPGRRLRAHHTCA